MSLVVRTFDGGVTARFIGLSQIEGVEVGDYEIPLEDFCVMATHFLGGGFFGWNTETPEPVGRALSYLFEIYEQVDGKWVRKRAYAPMRQKA